MANKKVFSASNKTGQVVKNAAGGTAIALTQKEALAKYVTTSMFTDTYYTSAEEQVKEIQAIVKSIDDNQFIAKCAIYARKNAGMKDTPAYLLNVLYDRNKDLFKKVFPIIIDSGRMLRTFSQIARSDMFKRNLSNKTFKSVYQSWFNSKTPDFIFRNSMGNDPSMVDIVKMTHIKSNENQDVISYLMGKPYEISGLPSQLVDYINWQNDRSRPVPDVDFRLLDSHKLTSEEWTSVLHSCNWNTLRMNLATFTRHGVFDDRKNVKFAAKKLTEKVPKNIFPYQVFSAYLMNKNNLTLAEALNEVMEQSVENIPKISGKTIIAVDTSGSMGHVVGNQNSSITCVEIASMFAASIARRCKHSVILPFDTQIHDSIENSNMSILTLADKLSKYGGGGTDIPLVLRYIQEKNIKFDNLVIVSDNESWVDRSYGYPLFSETWNSMNKGKKLVSLDLKPSSYSNANNKRTNNMFVSGFNDSVFTVISRFFEGQQDFVSVIEKVKI